MTVVKPHKTKASPLSNITPGLAFSHCFSAILFAFLCAHALKIKQVRDELGFYWIYHSHPMNQLVHFFFVPTLLWTSSIYFVHLELANITISLPFIPTHRINHSTIWMSFFAVLYTSLDPVGGALYLPILYFFHYGSAVWLHERDQRASKYRSWNGTGKLLQWAFLVHVGSWAIQIWAHQHYENGRPALMDSLAQSLTIAPLFAFYEGLWSLGINGPLKQHTLEQAEILTKNFCSSDSLMNVCQIFPSTS
ncbi:Protein of unknown function (DUF962) [Seminavis robusta]|uniref:Uncharacterized protein n=1 Tax=Seminavis robusta TaxID=568900 RepID=A0A9N8ETE5_9STRA|nr:Protein of unknown function (DUF962) [Seminavis robusta]|eukprot:Sro1822_g299830.1 Protein of unknown function (DUF962) (250) ;mRNA; f:10342-11091